MSIKSHVRRRRKNTILSLSSQIFSRRGDASAAGVGRTRRLPTPAVFGSPPSASGLRFRSRAKYARVILRQSVVNLRHSAWRVKLPKKDKLPKSDKKMLTKAGKKALKKVGKKTKGQKVDRSDVSLV
jgi:hypothetical protein